MKKLKLFGSVLTGLLLFVGIAFATVSTNPTVTGVLTPDGVFAVYSGNANFSDVTVDSIAVGNGKITADINLDDATGNEVALNLQYTTNKASSGNDTGLVINQTDTASPGTSLLIDVQAGGVSRLNVDNTGTASISGVLYANKMIANGNPFQSLWTSPGTTGAFVYDRTITNTGDQTIAKFNPTYNQASGTAANTDLLINRIETAIGSGDQLLIDAQVDGISKFSVSNTGNIYSGGVSTFTSMTTIFSDYSATNNMNQVLCDATAGDVDIHIVSASGVKGRVGNVKKIDVTGNNCIIEPAGAETIDGVSSRTISTQWENLTFFSDNTNLLIR